MSSQHRLAYLWVPRHGRSVGGLLEHKSLFLLKVSPERALPLWVQGHSLPELLFHHFLLRKVKTMGYPYQGNQERWESRADVLPKRC